MKPSTSWPQILIDPTQLERLATLAARHKLSPSGLLAMLLDLFLSQAEAREPDPRGFPLAGFVRLTELEVGRA